MKEKIRRIKKENYHIEVGHEPGTYDDDMDALIEDPVRAYERLQELKEKYHGHNIKITHIIETTTSIPITEGVLEKMLKTRAEKTAGAIKL